LYELKTFLPVEFHCQLTKCAWWWHNGSAAHQKVADDDCTCQPSTSPVTKPSHPTLLTLSHHTTHLLGPVKQHLGSQWFLNNREIKMAIGDQLQMQEPISATPRISEVVPIWEKSDNAIREYGDKR
jgi:hypothetical protein